MIAPVLRLTLLAFAGLALIAGLLLIAGAEHTDDWFSWTIEPPLSAAALGAFYWSAFVLLLTGSRATDWAGVRPIACPVLVISVVLLIVTLVHLDRFHTDSLFGVFWVGAYIVAPPLLAYGMLTERARSGGRRHAETGRALPAPLRALLGIESAVMLGAAAVMLLAPGTPADHWPWALTPLTSRALGAFTLGVGLVGAMVVAENRLRLFDGMAGAYVALGVLQLLAVALHSGDLGSDDLATGIYLGFLGAIALTGAYGSMAARASPSS